MTADRQCKLCGRWLPLTAFQGHLKTSTGVVYYERTCRQCAALKAACARSKPEPAAGKRRVCQTCGKDKPLAAYYLTANGKRWATCKPCARAKMRAYKRERRAADADYAERLRQRNRRDRVQRMVAMLDRVNAAPTEKLTPQNGFAKMKAEVADSQVPTKKWPGAVGSSPDREPCTQEVQ